MIKDELKKFPPGCIGGIAEYRYLKGNKQRFYYYFEEGKWLSSSVLSQILRKRRDLSFKEWYDYHYLPRDENGEYIYPKCKYCGENAKWELSHKCYLEYCENCSHLNRSLHSKRTIRKTLDKHGPVKTSLKGFQDRYGEEDGLKRYTEMTNKSSYSRSLQGHIDKYGEEDGKRIYESKRHSNSIGHTLGGYINKYGEEEGTKIWNKRRKAISDSRSLESLIKRHGEEKGKKMHEFICSQLTRNTSLKGMIDKYGEEEGTRRYQLMKLHKKLLWTDPDYCISLYGDDSKYRHLHSTAINNLSRVKYYSDISKKLFDSIIERIQVMFNDISEDVFYAEREWKIFNTWKVGDSKFLRSPDFLIKSKKIILEFNGDYWHKRPKCPEFMLSDIDLNMEDSIRSDLDKLQSYRRLGYKVFYIHEYEYRENPDIVIEECIKFITNESFRNEYTEIIDSILNIKYIGPLNEERVD